MFDGLKQNAKETASRTARSAALGLGALLCFGVGLGFLTVSAWIFLQTLLPPVQVALVIGFVYMGLGMILIAALAFNGDRTSERQNRQEEEDKGMDHPAAKLVVAFISGLQAGRSARS